MTTVTTRKEQVETASAARKVGGYSELVRLAAERAQKGKDSFVQKDAAGRWNVVSVKRK